MDTPCVVNRMTKPGMVSFSADNKPDVLSLCWKDIADRRRRQGGAYEETKMSYVHAASYGADDMVSNSDDADTIMMGDGVTAMELNIMDADKVRGAFIAFVSCSNILLEPCLHYSVKMTRSMATGKDIMMLTNCDSVRITSSMFSGRCGGFGLRLESCSNVLIENCAFYECGITIVNLCTNIVVRECAMHTFQDLSVTCMQTALVDIKAESHHSSTVAIEGCEFHVELSTSCLTARNIADSFSTMATPCFLSTSGACQLDVSKCTIVGTMGNIGHGTTFRFSQCIFKGDERIVSCLQSPVPAYQNGLQRVLYSEGRGSFSECDLGGGFVFIDRSGSKRSDHCKILTFDSCKFTLSPHPGVKVEKPVILQGSNVVLNITGAGTVLNVPSDPQMYNKESPCLLCQSVPWNMFRVSGTITMAFHKTTESAAKDAVTGFMRHMCFFQDGMEEGGRAMFRCIEHGVRVKYTTTQADAASSDVPVAVYNSLVKKGSCTFEVRPEFRLALVHGMDFVSAVQNMNENNGGGMLNGGGGDVLVMRHSVVTSNMCIQGGNIILMGPTLLQVKSPVTVTLDRVQVKNISSKGFQSFFSVVPDKLVLVKPGNASGKGPKSSVNTSRYATM